MEPNTTQGLEIYSTDPDGRLPVDFLSAFPLAEACQSLAARHTFRKLHWLTYDRTSLGQRLRELRDKADLSARELAKRIGVS